MVFWNPKRVVRKKSLNTFSLAANILKKQMYCNIHDAKTKMMISCAVTAHLICIFVFTYMQNAGFLMYFYSIGNQLNVVDGHSWSYIQSFRRK